MVGFMRYAAVVVAGILLAGCDDGLEPATPPILRNVTAGGGWWNGGCPSHYKALSGDHEALSPELTQRLAKGFPTGSEAVLLKEALRSQGFRMQERCATEPSIRLAEFRQTGGRFYGPYPVFAQVTWKQDDAGRLVWSKGHVAFTGP